MDKIQPRMKTHYDTYVRAKLQEEFAFSNSHQIPTLEKIVLNVGVGEAAKDQKLLVSVVEELEMISGQKANTNRAKRSISNFQPRRHAGGASVTLRRDRMWFFDRLISTAIPRIRDFRAINKIVRWPWQLHDGHSRANYFPRNQLRQRQEDHGMDLTFVTSTQKDDEGFGAPCAELPSRRGAGSGGASARERTDGQKSARRKGQEEAKVRGSTSQSLSAVRSPPRVSAIRDLPDLLVRCRFGVRSPV